MTATGIGDAADGWCELDLTVNGDDDPNKMKIGFGESSAPEDSQLQIQCI
jgi:hypothetical protein